LPGALALAGPHAYRGAPVAIALPSAGAAVEGGNELPAAVYDLVTGAEESAALEVRISKFEDDLWIPISILHLTRATLQECVEAAAAEARVHGGPDETPDYGGTRWPACAYRAAVPRG